MKRGPKSLRTPKLQKRICEILADANTIQTACDACGIGEKTYFRWCQKHPTFLTATREARARAKIKLVDIVRNAARINAKHAEWLLERSWPNEYARVERVEQVNEADDKKLALNILYSTGNHTLAQLLDFPNAETDTLEVAQQKQARLMGEAPAPEKISDAPPPKVVPAHMMGDSCFRCGRQRD